MIKWISVLEQMPPSHETLLFLCDDGDIYQGRMCYGLHQPWFCGHSQLNFGTVISDLQKVTHWIKRDDFLKVISS